MRFVLDNSVVMRWYFGDGTKSDLAYAAKVLDAMTNATVIVPQVWMLEVANVISRAEAKCLTTESRSEAFLEVLNRLNIVTDGFTSNRALSNILQLARRYGLSVYDAA